MSFGGSRAATAEERQREIQEQFAQHVMDYAIELEFPAEVIGNAKTNSELIQHRLLEAGLLFDGDGVQSIGEVSKCCTQFVENMERSGCFEKVQVKIDDGSSSTAAAPSSVDNSNSNSDASETNTSTKTVQKLQVILKERNWYKLYIGGGIKQDKLIGGGMSSSSSLPKVEFETTASLLNLTGHLDKTVLQYTIDQTSTSSLGIHHERPFYSLFEQDSNIYQQVLSMADGSQLSCQFKAILDSIDHQYTKSFKQDQRTLSVRLSSLPNVSFAQMPTEEYEGWEWSFGLRDVIPRRSQTLPYQMEASPHVVAQAGPTTKHAIKFEYRTNGSMADSKFNPTRGVDAFTEMELAGPPGDVGFVKVQGGGSVHMPLVPGTTTAAVALHLSVVAGYLHPLSFRGLCGIPTISDKFFLGGPLNLRAFAPCGIGPRSPPSSSPSHPTPGDALGGDLFWRASLMASMPLNIFRNAQQFGGNNLRLFGFVNAGTLVANPALSLSSMTTSDIWTTTRIAAGGGIGGGFPGLGRMEVTYGVPLRYGHQDIQKKLQFGFGFTFG